ncbi:MAG TPA: HIT domain-containing protein [Aliiroseovarius sp.]|nr:HIT domain-containing protein [Aliiroseovarius sp.]
MAYDNDNIFAKILRGEIPAIKVFEDAATFAFMDIMPRGTGHMLVIPKAPMRNLLDADPAALAACVQTAQKLAVAAQDALGADGITLQQFSEEAGGQEVFHLHFHVIPRFAGQALGRPGIMGDMEAIAATAEKIRAKLGAGA